MGVQTMKPKAKVPMTEREMATADSSRLPMWPTKMEVIELMPNKQKILTAMGTAILHVLMLSIHIIFFSVSKLLTGA